MENNQETKKELDLEQAEHVTGGANGTGSIFATCSVCGKTFDLSIREQLTEYNKHRASHRPKKTVDR